MTAPGPSLGDLVRQARIDAKMSLRDVERASGGKVAFGNVRKIENGTVTQPGPRALEGLSKALGLPMSRLRTAAGHPARVPSQTFVLPERADFLTAKERTLVLALIDALLDARQAGS